MITQQPESRHESAHSLVVCVPRFVAQDRSAMQSACAGWPDEHARRERSGTRCRELSTRALYARALRARCGWRQCVQRLYPRCGSNCDGRIERSLRDDTLKVTTTALASRARSRAHRCAPLRLHLSRVAPCLQRLYLQRLYPSKTWFKSTSTEATRVRVRCMVHAREAGDP